MLQRRLTILSTVFVFCCLVSSARLVYEAPRPRSLRASADNVPLRSDRRFAELKKALPVRGVVGYVEDPDESPNTDDGAYYLTQYALAPLIVDHSPNHPLVVGNFPKLSGAQPPVKLRLLRDFGDGVFLFAGEGQ